ncbi:MAG: DUF1292 domain-containing protein [Bacillota bacterium]|nr:DUF1292 domain-containing protein [Bacillota bacterium]MDW7683257.1 DUF1292 domain-containing protein [Bacillota bacterium]
MTELRDDIVTLLDEEGQEHAFMVLDIIMVNDSEYAIMVPAEEGLVNSESDEQEAIIFRIDETDGEQALVVVEDDAEWDAVAAAWEELVDSEEDEDEEQ